MAPTTRSISVNVSSTSSAEDSQGSAHMPNNCAIALALLLIATGMLALLARVYSPSSPSLSSSATFPFSSGPSATLVHPLPSSPTQQSSPPGYPLDVAGGYYMIESGSCGGGAILTTSECDAAATALGLPDKTSTDIKHHIVSSLIPRGCVFRRSFLYVFRGGSSGSCSSSRQCICTFTPPSPPPSPPSQLPSPPPSVAAAIARAAAHAATRPKESHLPKVSPSLPSSQSPSGATRLIHTATLEPVCIGRAHTLTVDKAMVINFKSIIHEEEDEEDEEDEDQDEATEKKPAAALVLPTLTCVATLPAPTSALPQPAAQRH